MSVGDVADPRRAIGGRRSGQPVPVPSPAAVAVAVGVVDAVALGTAMLVAARSGIRLAISESGAWLNVVAGPTFPLLAALVLRAGVEPGGAPAGPGGRERRLAWGLLGFGVVCAATIVLHVVAALALRDHAAGSLAAAWVSTWLWTAVPTTFLLLLLWFPTGDAPAPRWRFLVPVIVLAYGLMTASVALAPGVMADFTGGHRNPLGIRSAAGVLPVLGGIGFVALAVAGVGTVAAVVWRFLRGDAEVRAQLRWLVVGVALIAATMIVPVPDSLGRVGQVSTILAVCLLPVTLALTLTRRQRLVPPRVLVYGLLSTLLLAGYLGVVGGAESAFGGRSDRVATLVAAGLVAVAAAPLRGRLQRGVDRLVYGESGDPYRALSQLGHRISGSPDDLLQQVVETVADALRAPWAAIVLRGDEQPAAAVGVDRAWSEPDAGDLAVPLVLRGEPVGSLVVGRSAGLRYGSRERALLDELSRHVAVAAHASALTRDLQRSRESLVLAREEERRRIRRDLHDGLGPALAGVAFGLDAARNTVDRNPDAARAALAELRGEVQTSLADVRRLVYDLRPPTLDQLGLVAAVDELAARLRERGVLAVRVGAGQLPDLPAAVEVAAYRIATEALTNAARHACARQAEVRLAVEAEQLTVVVEDDGVGLRDASRAAPGIGLEAMRERATELGGSLTVVRREPPFTGTTVTAVLPLWRSR